jgi:hypothetical protein
MSWGVSAIGKAPAVAVAIAKQFSNSSPCVEPEESVRLGAAALIAASLAGYDSSGVVSVSANGHQSTTYPTNAIVNALNIDIRPQHGFIE